MDEKKFLLKKIEKHLVDLDEIPLFRGEKLLLEKFSSLLSKEIEKEIEISFQEMAWQKKTDIFKNEKKAFQQCFSALPLSGNFYLIIEDNIKDKLTKTLLFENKAKRVSFPLKDGFFRFTLLKALNILNEEPPFKNLNFKIIENVQMVAEVSFCIKIKIKIKDAIFYMNLAITDDFRKSWNNFFASAPSIFKDKIEQNIFLPVSVILASTSLSAEKLKKIKKGDFIILDKSYTKPKKDIFNVLIMIKDILLFQAKIKHNKIEIFDFANFEEETMAKEKPTNIDELPLDLKVELATISMPLEKIKNLQPGNFIDINTSLENQVDLTVNNKKIGKGKLTYLGEVLGVIISELE